MSEMTKERALQILKSRKVVNGVGKYQVKVTSVHPFEDKHIVNVNAMNLYQAKQAREDLAKEAYEDAANSNLSMSIFEGQKCPAKGEFINIQVGEVETKDGDTALLVVGWSEMPVSQGVSFDFEAEETTAEAELQSELENQ